MNLTQFIAQRRVFVSLYIIAAAVAFAGILATDQLELHLSINQALPAAFDTPMKYLTLLGDGRFAPFLLVPLLFMDWRKFLIALGSMAIVGLVIAGLKHLVFDDVMRPFATFAEGQLRLVDGVKMHMSNSFPSGHAACTMSLAFGWLLATRNIGIQLLGAAVVLVGAFSRVYLSQHYMEDIVAGTAVSLSVSCLLCYFALKLKWLRYE